jgi:hypothetical protein
MKKFILFSLIFSSTVQAQNLWGFLNSFDEFLASLNPTPHICTEQDPTAHNVDAAEVKMLVSCDAQATLEEEDKIKNKRTYRKIHFYETSPPSLQDQGLVIRSRMETESDFETPVSGPDTKTDFTVKRRPMVPPANWRELGEGKSEFKCERDAALRQEESSEYLVSDDNVSCSATHDGESTPTDLMNTMLPEGIDGGIFSPERLAELRLPPILNTKMELKKLNTPGGEMKDIDLEKWVVKGPPGTPDLCLLEVSYKVKDLDPNDVGSQQRALEEAFGNMQAGLANLGVTPLPRQEQGNKTGRAIQHLLGTTP